MLEFVRQNTLRAAALVILGAGCGQGYEDSELPEFATVQQDINGGTKVDATTNAQIPASASVYIGKFDNDLCGATKIGQTPNRDTYITAAHCLAFGLAGPNTPIRIGNGLDSHPGSPPPVQPRIKELFRHPSYDANIQDPTPGFNTQNSYDVAIFTLDRNATDPPIPAGILAIPALKGAPVIDPRHIVNPERGRLYAYGCNTFTPSLDGFKQTALITAGVQGSASNAAFARYIRNVGLSGCGGGGDSGSSLTERNSGLARIMGIVAHNFNGDTYFARTANVRRWIAAPHKLNVIANNEMGFLLNHARRRCAAIDEAGQTTLFHCDGRNQPVDDQYWKLLSVPATTFFQVQNTFTGQCWSSPAPGGLNTQISPVSCNSASTSQHFGFSAPISAPFGVPPHIKISTRVGSLCVTSPNATPDQLHRLACNSSAKEQDWYFFP